MSIAADFHKKVLANAELAQIVFRVAVLERYLAQNDTKITRTNTVGRVKASSWSLDFGIAPDEQTIHVPLLNLKTRLPEKELAHWLAHVDDSRFSQNYLKMQSAHSCIDDGGYREWGEEESLF
jgi:hypothetical protein